MKRRLVILVVAACAVVGGVAGAFSIPPTVITGGAAGDVHVLATEPVAAGDVGKDCEVVAVTTNNESVREGSDLLVDSGGHRLTFGNVEHSTTSQTFTGRLVVGPTIIVSVRLGPAGEFSGGADVVRVNCPQVGPPSSSPPTPARPVPVPPPFTG